MAAKISKEKISELREQLLKNLQFFPEDKRDFIKKKITTLDDKEFLEFLKENQILDQKKEQYESNCVFCNIAQEKIPSYKINEDKENMAILELNPITAGHALVIPKKHTEQKNLHEATKEYAKKI